jgi:lia operon protein LiaF
MGTNRTVIFWGLVLVVGGLVLLAGNLFNINVWALFWPVVLIALGVWFLIRPTHSLPGGVTTARFVGEIRRSGPWQVANEEFSQFVGDMRLDMSQAVIQPGETHLRFSGFVGDLTFTVPEGVGVSLAASSFVSEVNLFGQHRSSIFTPVDFSTPGYATAERRLRVEMSYFVVDAKFRQG